MKTTIYHNPACSKSCETLTLLQHANEDLSIINYLNTPPSAETLCALIQMLGIKPIDLVRKKEELYIRKFQGSLFTDDEWIHILAQNPILIERPIVVKNGKAVIGRPPILVQTIL